MHSQGVFGFINQKRTTAVLSYTHEPRNASCAKGEADGSWPPCTDTAGPIGTDHRGQPLTCAELGSMCADARQGGQIRSLCALTCGACERGDGAACAGADAYTGWRLLELKNLPGDVRRMPGFNSPYHYRLDWEVCRSERVRRSR